MTIELWHNPRCSKSRSAVALFEENGIPFKVRLYLQDAPSASEIKKVISLLTISPRELMRKGEAVYRELGLKDEMSDAALINAMVEHPILIERPVGITKSKAIIGRPPEDLLGLI